MHSQETRQAAIADALLNPLVPHEVIAKRHGVSKPVLVVWLVKMGSVKGQTNEV